MCRLHPMPKIRSNAVTKSRQLLIHLFLFLFYVFRSNWSHRITRLGIPSGVPRDLHGSPSLAREGSWPTGGPQLIHECMQSCPHLGARMYVSDTCLHMRLEYRFGRLLRKGLSTVQISTQAPPYPVYMGHQYKSTLRPCPLQRPTYM